MSENLSTFMNIFESDINSVRPKKIVIPMIQRDYAQGRQTAEINRIRSRFLDTLYNAIANDKPVKLDFVYGDLKSDGTLIPLDGQQRLTTLFLLHVYATKKEEIPPEETGFLEKFSYETRPDSREFCKFLIECKPEFPGEPLSAQIENMAKFPLSWKKDPTISSMLVMFDAINEKFCDVKNIWQKLKDGAISFYFLALEKMGLTDEIYITMNSRGKPLTDFEHFKAEFKHKLDEIDEVVSEKILLKIDTVWTDLLWHYRDKKTGLVDGCFLKFFNFICDIILYKDGKTPRGRNREPFALLEEFFCGDNDKVLKNLKFLEERFDALCSIENERGIAKFFESVISRGSRKSQDINRHEPGKIIFYSGEPDIFGDCLRGYGQIFSLAQTVMLHTFITYFLNMDKVSESDFRRRVRIVNNLLTNSNDELSDSEERQGGNRLPAMSEQVENIILEGKILQLERKPNFNVNQIAEEKEKITWLEQNPDKAELLFELEDHFLLYGQIGIVGYDYPEYFKRFISLFDCDYDKIDCALTVQGDYFQNENRSKIYQAGSIRPSSWQNLFHKSSNKNFDYTKEYLEKLLMAHDNFSNDLLDKIAADYLADCEKKSDYDRSYYYIKYKDFRPGCFGKYWWDNYDEQPYCLMVMVTAQRFSENAYQPFLKEACKNFKGKVEVYKDYFGVHYEFWDDKREYCIVCENSAFVLKNKDYAEEDRLEIIQENGVDKENRIEKLKNWEWVEYFN